MAKKALIEGNIANSWQVLDWPDGADIMFPLLSYRLETYAIITDDKEITSIKSEMEACV